MHNRIVRCFLSLFASALMVQAAHAEKSATFTLFTPRYYVGDAMVASSPSFVLGQRGTFTSTESFSSSTSFSVNASALPKGYYVSKWLLSTSWGAGLSGTTVKSQEGGTSFTVTFDYNWATKYGTAFDLTVYLSPISYSLSYDANGGIWTTGQPWGETYKYSDTVTAPSSDSVRRDNYNFAGWKRTTGETVAAGAGFDGSTVGVTQNGETVVLYAQWTPAEYKVTLNKNGGRVDYELTGYTYGVGATLPSATKKNCRFEGWFDSPTLVSNLVTKISKTDSGDLEFWAKFVQQDTVVHYNGNGATAGTMSDSSFAYNTPMALTKNGFSREYTVTYNANGGSVATGTDKATYTFKCWNDKANGKGAYSYNDLQDVTNPCGSEGDPVTLFAQWNDEPVTVTLPTPTPPAGKELAGWFTAQTGGIRVGGAGDKYEPPRSIALYAQWKDEKTYTLRFSPNADVVNPGAMKDITCKSGVAVTLPACAYTNLASLGFAGWEYGGEKYKAGDSFDHTIANEGETVVIGATWQGVGELSKAVGLNNAILTNVSAEVTVWTTNTTEGAYYSSEKPSCISCSEDNSTIAMIVLGPGKVSFRHKRSGSGILHLYIDEVEKSVSAVDNYQETPLSFDVIGSGNHTISFTFTSSRSGWYYIDTVEWEPSGDREVTVSTHPADAGTVTGGGTYKAGEEATLAASANAGYEFVRWSDGSTENPRTVKVMCDETYEAVFAGGEKGPTYYYLLFYGNGADNLAAMDGQRVTCGETETLAANKFSRSGYTFVGWATTRTGAVAYGDQAPVKDLAGEDGRVSLYAVWEEIPEPEPVKTPVTVTVTGNSATVEYTGAQQSVSGYTFTTDVADYTAADFAFKGNAVASGVAVGTYAMNLSPGDFENKNDDYDVTFVVNDGKLVITQAEPEPEPGHYSCMVGETVLVDLAGAYPDSTIKRVTGLPSGLTYNKTTGYVKGTAKKAEFKIVTVTFADGSSDTVTWTVLAGENHGVKIDFGGAATGETSAKVSVGAATVWTVASVESGAKVTVSKLPSGLKYDKKTGLVTGTPKKAGTYAMTVKTVVGGQTVGQTFAITVEALPEMMVGTYYGVAQSAGGATEQFQLKLTAAGKATGFFYAAGKKITLKSLALEAADDSYVVTVSYSYGRVKHADDIVLKRAATVDGVDVWSAALDGTSGALQGLAARRDTIKENFGKVVPKTMKYDIADESFAEGEYLVAKVSPVGVVKVTGKLMSAEGALKSVSCATHLVVGNDGTPYCLITIYKAVGKSEPIVYEAIWELPE